MQMGKSGKYHLSEETQSQEHTWHALTDEQILAQKLGIPKTQFTYQMMPKKKEGVDPGPEKAQCRSVEEYQDREVGEG